MSEIKPGFARDWVEFTDPNDDEEIFNKKFLVDSVVYQFTDKQKFVIDLNNTIEL